jgi:anthranilate/para-aminobenzoate synthase component I
MIFSPVSKGKRLFEISQQRISTRPIAGTRRCGNAEEMERFKRELVLDPKEHAEHAMLVDLARNDLGRICKHGSVVVSHFMDIVPYATVIHTESEVQGTLREDLPFIKIMQALFPGGTITGVPKIRTMEIIHELEPCARGIYTGALGYWSICGHADFNIMIRPIFCKQGKAFTHAGGGITHESLASREYKETLHKTRAQMKAIQEANGVPYE